MDGWREGGRERGSRKNVRGREGRCETETNLTHHDALNIPNKRLLSPSVAGLNCAKEEKKTNSIFSTLHQGGVYYPITGILLERERAAKHLCHSAQKQPSQYFLIKLLASSRESLHGRSVLSSARFHCECRDTDSCLVYLVEVWCGGWYQTSRCQRASPFLYFVKPLNSCGVRCSAGITKQQKKNSVKNNVRVPGWSFRYQ